MKTQVIVPAAGLGVRLKSSIPKTLILLNDKPLVVYCLEVFQKCSFVDSVLLVAGKEIMSAYKSFLPDYDLTKVTKLVEGGATRRESVAEGLNALDSDTDIVIVHDGARPFITAQFMESCFSAALNEEALITAVLVKPTIKMVNRNSMLVESTLDRSQLWEVQTPQIFKRKILEKAHRDVQLYDPSDDALLVEKLGGRVKVMLGDERNIKITTQEDVAFAEAILKLRETEHAVAKKKKK